MERSKVHCLQHASATYFRPAGAVMVMASGGDNSSHHFVRHGDGLRRHEPPRPPPHSTGEDHG